MVQMEKTGLSSVDAEPERVEIEVHHSLDSQVKVVVPFSQIEKETDTASEGDFLTPGQKVAETLIQGASPSQNALEDMEMKSQVTEVWKMITEQGKRKAKISSDEEGDGNTIRLGTGSFVNSFLNSSSQRSKRQNTEGTGGNVQTELQFEDASNVT